MREAIIAGNWKMYKTIPESEQFLNALLPLVEGAKRTIFLAVPFTAIGPCANQAEGSVIQIGAQNMHDASEGAFTGEIAAKMLSDVKASFVVLGHSERRHLFGESSSFINKKVKQALKEGLRPLLCLGETLEEREAGSTEAVLAEQLEVSLEGVLAEEMDRVILAYEPVWAIGTGHTATPELAEGVHTYLRTLVKKKWGSKVGDRIPLLYGGSVKPDNASALLGCQDVDGLLVGGASLSPENFSQIVRA